MEKINYSGVLHNSSSHTLQSPSSSISYQNYIDDINDPVACKFEAILASFTCQVHLDEVVNMTNVVNIERIWSHE